MQEPAIRRGTDEHPGNGFGCGARIAQRFGAQRVEVLLVKHAIATRDDHTRDLLIEAGAMRPKLGNAVEFPGPEQSAHCWNLVRRCAADHAPPPRSCRPKSRIRTSRTVFRQGGENCVTYERVALAPHAVSRQIAC